MSTFAAYESSRKFIMRYPDGSVVRGRNGLPDIFGQSAANRFIFAARAMHCDLDDIPEAIPVEDFGVIQ